MMHNLVVTLLFFDGLKLSEAAFRCIFKREFQVPLLLFFVEMEKLASLSTKSVKSSFSDFT